MDRELETWASARSWRYVPVWDAMRHTFRGGGLSRGGVRYATDGWIGTYGGMPCFGFASGPGEYPVGRLQVIAVNVPGVRFPALTIKEAHFALDGTGLTIDPWFDLSWHVTTSSERFARDVLVGSMQRELMGMVPDFYELWFEHDAVLVSSLIPIEPEMIDRYLTFLRRLIDLIPPQVVAALRAEARAGHGSLGLDTGLPWGRVDLSWMVGGIDPTAGVRPAAGLDTPAARASRAALEQGPSTSSFVPHERRSGAEGGSLVPHERRSGASSPWRPWAADRGWLYAPNARQIVERYHHAPVPQSEGARFTEGFVGKFGDLPCFGWRSIVKTESGGERIRHALCLRRPGLDLKPVRITLEDQLLAELIGSGDIEVGDTSFDERWRVTSEDADFARRLLTQQVWSAFMGPDVPKFGQLWFERDVVAVVTEGPIAPEAVDGYLRFLHLIMSSAHV